MQIFLDLSYPLIFLLLLLVLIFISVLIATAATFSRESWMKSLGSLLLALVVLALLFGGWLLIARGRERGIMRSADEVVRHFLEASLGRRKYIDPTIVRGADAARLQTWPEHYFTDLFGTYLGSSGEVELARLHEKEVRVVSVSRSPVPQPDGTRAYVARGEWDLYADTTIPVYTGNPPKDGPQLTFDEKEFTVRIWLVERAGAWYVTELK